MFKLMQDGVDSEQTRKIASLENTNKTIMIQNKEIKAENKKIRIENQEIKAENQKSSLCNLPGTFSV